MTRRKKSKPTKPKTETLNMKYCREQVMQFNSLVDVIATEDTINSTDFDTITNESVLPGVYHQTLNAIRMAIRGHKLCVSITIGNYSVLHEQTKFANVIVSILAKKSKVFLINSRQVLPHEPNKEQFYVKLFQDSMKLLWPEKSDFWQNEYVVMLITESTDGMQEAAKKLHLCESYPKLVCLTCFDHILHGYEQLIAQQFPDVSVLFQMVHLTLFSITRKQFVFDTKLSQLESANLLNNFLMNVNYFYNFFDILKDFFVNQAKIYDQDLENIDFEQLFDPSVQRQLSVIKAKYQNIIKTREMIQTKVTFQDRPQTMEMLIAIEQLREKLSKWPAELDKRISGDFGKLIREEIVGMQIFILLANLSQEKEEYEHVEVEKGHFFDVAPFKYAPVAALTRARYFPKTEQLMYVSKHTFPSKWMHVYNVLYCYQEATTSDKTIFQKLDMAVAAKFHLTGDHFHFG